MYEELKNKPERVVYKEVIKEQPVPVQMETVQAVRAAAPPPPAPAVVSRPRMVGLGLALERSSNDKHTYVHEIITGFAAYKSGQFQEGDVVLAVDQEPIEGWDLDAIKQLTIGEEGSFCTLQMMRGDRYFAVTLQRMSPNSINDDNFEAARRISSQSGSYSY